MSEPVPSTWSWREEPVLRTVVRLYDETLSPIAIGEVEAELPDLSHDDIQRGAHALATAGYFDTMGAHGLRVLRIGAVSERARRESGQWPAAEATDRLLDALREAAESGTTEEVRSRARRAFDALSGAGRDIAVGVTTAVLTGQVT